MIAEQISEFQKIVLTYYHEHSRDFPWRRDISPYRVLVSEIMLQQTQTDRVVHKFLEFMEKFPTLEQLAMASQASVVIVWQGLGYNRRALFLHQAAQQIVEKYAGIIPDDPVILETLPGIGKATAAAICAYAYNMPTIFIETNIRAVFIYHFFHNQSAVHDRDIVNLVEKTVVKKSSRDWYYALMDYGVMLKKMHKNPARKSAHHIKQTQFEGSERQIRGMILRVLSRHRAASFDLLCAEIKRDPVRIEKNLQNLVEENLVCQQDTCYSL